MKLLKITVIGLGLGLPMSFAFASTGPTKNCQAQQTSFNVDDIEPKEAAKREVRMVFASQEQPAKRPTQQGGKAVKEGS
ncbi:MAG: hypothetical protein AB7G93_19705 [Bdellovibrionales bacterium]